MRAKRPSLTIAIVIVAAFLGYLEMTVVITALPTLGKVFPTATSWLPWLTAVSLMAAGIALPVSGKLADDWGPRKVFLLGMGLFTLSSLLSGLVGLWLPNRLELVIAFRILQGLGGGSFAPVGLKMVSVYYRGKTRTTTIGLAGAIGPLASVLGPNVGGILVDHFPWQSIFLVNVPLGVLVGLAAWLFMEEIPSRRKASIDLAGALLLSAAILAAMLGLTWLREGQPVSLHALGAIFLAAMLAGLLYPLERQRRTPLLDLKLMAEKDMAAILALSFVQGLAMYSTLYFLSFYAQFHPAILATGSEAGLMLSPAALGQVVAAPLAGYLISRTGYRSLVVAGVLLTALSLLVVVTQPTQLAILAGLLFAGRIGGAMTAVPLAAAGLEARREQAGTITGLRQLSNVLGGALGPVALNLLLPASSSGGIAQNGFAIIFLLVGALLLVSLPLARFIPKEERGLAPAR